MSDNSNQDFIPFNIDPKDVAEQLRKPEGEFGLTVADNLNESNIHITNFTYNCMNVADGERLLEIGFGNGKLMNILLKKANNLHLAGIDFSETMTHEARAHHEQNIASGIVDIQHGSVDAILYPDNSFDKICHINTLYFWPDPLACAKETRRVLKDGGSICTGIRSEAQMKLFPFTQFGFTFYTEQSAKQLFEDAGFSKVTVQVQEDPVLNYKGEDLQLQSICIVATK